MNFGRLLVSLMITAASATSASGQSFAVGDVLAQTTGSTPQGTYSQLIQLSGDGTVKYTTPPYAGAYGDVVPVDPTHYLATFINDIRTVALDGSFATIHTSSTTPANRLSLADSGLFYSTTSGDIRRVSGNAVTSRLSSVNFNGFDVAADQCGVLMAAAGAVLKLDFCTGVESVFANTAVFARSVRILANGDVLVAAYPSAALLDASGATIKTYSDGGSMIAVAADGKSFWIAQAGTNQLYHVDIATGQRLAGPVVIGSGSPITALGVAGEPRVARSAPASAFSGIVEAPMLSVSGAACMVLLLAVVAIGAMRM